VLKGSIKWKVGPDVKDNALQVTSSLSDFFGVNIVSVHDVVIALDVKKSRVAEMETTLATIKESTASEKTKEIQQVKQAYEEDIKRKLRA